MKTVELGFIYVLQNPITGEFFYVGATEHSLKSRLHDEVLKLFFGQTNFNLLQI